MGRYLALRFLTHYTENHIDCVIPIPETSRSAAQECARILQLPYREGFIKNRYIARTFIMPHSSNEQVRNKLQSKSTNRQNAIRLKLNTIKSEFKDKRVLLIDDSIVRGSTSMELVKMARDAGAKEVYFASAAPPVLFPNFYGIDMPTSNELIAAKYLPSWSDSLEFEQIIGNEETMQQIETQVALEIQADYVLFNRLDDVRKAVASLQSDRLQHGFEDSCFSGQYIAGTPDSISSQQL